MRFLKGSFAYHLVRTPFKTLAAWLACTAVFAILAQARGDCRSIGISLQTTVNLPLNKDIVASLNENLDDHSRNFYATVIVNNTCYNTCRSLREKLAIHLNDRTKNPDACRHGSGVCSLNFRSQYNYNGGGTQTACSCYVVMEYKRYQKDMTKNHYTEGIPEEIDASCALSAFANFQPNVDAVVWTAFKPETDGDSAYEYNPDVYCDIQTFEWRSRTILFERCQRDGLCLNNNEFWMFTSWIKAKNCEHAAVWPTPNKASSVWRDAYDGYNCQLEPDSSCLVHCPGPWRGNS